MILKKIVKSLWKLSLLVIIPGLFIPGTIAAEEAEILTIKPPSEIKRIEPPPSLPRSGGESKASKYGGLGYISRIDQNEIVIDDTIYTLASTVKFRNKRDRTISRSKFTVNAYVGFNFRVAGKESEEGKKLSSEITELWLLKK